MYIILDWISAKLKTILKNIVPLLFSESLIFFSFYFNFRCSEISTTLNFLFVFGMACVEHAGHVTFYNLFSHCVFLPFILPSFSLWLQIFVTPLASSKWGPTFCFQNMYYCQVTNSEWHSDHVRLLSKA